MEPLDRGSELSLLFLCFEWGFDVSEDVDITEDCLENWPRQDKAATSKAEAADPSESLADVSTYITAPD